jgi:hypothetical protein
MRTRLFAATAAILVLSMAPDWAQDEPPATPYGGSEVSPAARRSIHLGIKWLIANQNPDGSWGCERGQPPSVALTSLSILVLMADGSTPDRGPHSAQIRRGLKWIDGNKTRGGLMSAYDSTAMGEVYEHASGTLMLATLYGMGRHKDDRSADENEKLRGILEDSLDKLSRLQLRDGGFGKTAQGGSDPGVAAMAYLALRTGYACGFKKAQADLDKLKEYGRALIANGGGRIYPTACSLRLFVGHNPREAFVDDVSRQLLTKRLGQDYGKMSEWDYMAAFYSVGALIHDDKSEAWKKWFPYVRDFLIKIQQPDGSWIVEYCLHCKVFATTLSLLSLQMPGRYLPSTQY